MSFVTMLLIESFIEYMSCFVTLKEKADMNTLQPE
jgi:hypothetical protein